MSRTQLFDLDGKIAFVSGASRGIGEAIAKGLCEYLGAAYVPARQEAPKPAEPAQGDTLYRVQVGAFAVRANAEKMLQRLKDAGFDGFIREGSR